MASGRHSDARRGWRVWARRAATGLVAVFVLVMVVATIGPRALPYRTFAVLSGSMSSEFAVGSMIVDRVVDAEELKVGDVITFHPPGEGDGLVTHRIVRIEQEERGPVFVTKGDMNAREDDWRVPARGSGLLYLFEIPYLGYLTGGLLSPSGRLAVLIIATFWLGGRFLWHLWRPQRPEVAVPG